MDKRADFLGLARFVAATTGRNMTMAAYVAVVIGAVMILLLTIQPAYAAARLWIEGVLWGCLGFFAFEWAVRLRHAFRAGRPSSYQVSGRGLLDAACVLVVPLALMAGIPPRNAWLFAVIWLTKVIPGIPGLRQLRRVLVIEAGPLFSVLLLFLTVWFLGSVIIYFLERDAQPEVFSNLPSAMWWAVVTLTTTGYGDAVPITPLGRVVAGLIMICGLGVFGLWTGILATAFAAEMRRENFIRTWQAVTKVPFFADLGPAAIADVTQMLRTIDLPPRVTLIRKGQQGDCMYFLAEGEVEVDLPGKKVRLSEGSFFGEMALLGNNLRSANIMTTRLSKLLVLDLVDFRLLMARHPELAQTIDAEAKRRALENQ